MAATPAATATATTAERWGRRAEMWWPWVVAGVTFYCLHRWRGDRAPAATVRDVLAAAINISAIGVGFLATAKAIILSASEMRPIKALKQAGSYKTLIMYMIAAIWVLFALAAATAAILLLDTKPENAPHWFGTVFNVWCAGAVLASALTARVILLFGAILLRSG